METPLEDIYTALSQGKKPRDPISTKPVRYSRIKGYLGALV